MTDLAGRRIAVTRAEAGELGARLVDLGADVVHVPLIEITDPPDGGLALRRALLRLDAFDWLVVTSANGAVRVGAAAAAHPSVRLGAVGPATARALAAAAGRPAELVASVPRVEGLLAEFPRPAARVLVAQANRAATTLAEGLAAMGHQVETATAYATAIRRPSEAETARLRDVDAVVFASGSAVSGWAAAVGSTGPPVVVAVGPVTARAAVAAGLAATHVAAAPDAASVAAVLARALARP